MKSLKFNIRPTLCLGRLIRKMFYSFWVSVAVVPTSVRGFLGRLARNMEYGFAVEYIIDLFTQGAISRDGMLEKLDELEEKFNRKL